MKWFFALNEAAFEFERYAELTMVAVHTALMRTALEPYCVYDGSECGLTRWLHSRGVRIIPHRSFLAADLHRLASERGDRNIAAIGCGAFLRVEIPRLAHDLGLTDTVVLYTDVDVMFKSSVASLDVLTPRYFAVAPEWDKTDFVRMNTGVMLMNVKSLRAIDQEFRRFLVQNLSTLIDQSWDQDAYRRYFWRFEFLAKFGGTKWDRLPVEYNWKPYWGHRHDVSIVHFHGPKPHQARLLQQPTEIAEEQRWMVPLAGAAYRAFADEWRNRLYEATGRDQTGS